MCTLFDPQTYRQKLPMKGLSTSKVTRYSEYKNAKAFLNYFELAQNAHLSRISALLYQL
jgi:hypothetical protein